MSDEFIEVGEESVVPPMEEREEEEVIIVDELPVEESEKEEKPEIDINELIRKNEELKSKADSNVQLMEGFNNLASSLKGSVRGGTQAVGESDEDFQKRIEKELFGKNPLKALNEYNQRTMGPVVQQLQSQNAMLQKKLYSSDPIVKKYGKEIEEKLESLGTGKNNPGAYDWALKEVKMEKQDEIIADQVQAKVEEMLRDKGIGSGSVKKKGAYVETGGYGRGEASPKAKKYITRTEADSVDRLMRYGMSREDATDKVIRERNGGRR